MTNRKHIRLKAFTVIELMVALVLTALAISFVYAGIRFVHRQNTALTQQLAHFDEFNRLHRALQSDANGADEIRYYGTGIDFQSRDKAVSFIPIDSVCIREVSGVAADTFNIRVDSMACWFEGMRLEGTGSPLDRAAIHVSVFGNPLAIALEKVYDAATLIDLTSSTNLQ
ncbi:PulJ/GspJ family protein [Parapedobacter tibetensis]|uniref:PulJ/GspJ family protein n=1 Tax=Parapedobacter tibetensis TaxID=2972951 RepID=UPI00214D78CE|nr:prepilin-type N-terminal cleavage/methylation domain-containing protein [Parapedobacter tibetensis]